MSLYDKSCFRPLHLVQIDRRLRLYSFTANPQYDCSTCLSLCVASFEHKSVTEGKGGLRRNPGIVHTYLMLIPWACLCTRASLGTRIVEERRVRFFTYLRTQPGFWFWGDFHVNVTKEWKHDSNEFIRGWRRLPMWEERVHCGMHRIVGASYFRLKLAEKLRSWDECTGREIISFRMQIQKSSRIWRSRSKLVWIYDRFTT